MRNSLAHSAETASSLHEYALNLYMADNGLRSRTDAREPGALKVLRARDEEPAAAQKVHHHGRRVQDDGKVQRAARQPHQQRGAQAAGRKAHQVLRSTPK